MWSCERDKLYEKHFLKWFVDDCYFSLNVLLSTNYSHSENNHPPWIEHFFPTTQKGIKYKNEINTFFYNKSIHHLRPAVVFCLVDSLCIILELEKYRDSAARDKCWVQDSVYSLQVLVFLNLTLRKHFRMCSKCSTYVQRLILHLKIKRNQSPSNNIMWKMEMEPRDVFSLFAHWPCFSDSHHMLFGLVSFLSLMISRNNYRGQIESEDEYEEKATETF